MLTINIPDSDVQKSAEDELAQYILDNLKKSGKCQFIYYYSGTNRYPVNVGDWCEGSEEFCDMKIHVSSTDAIHNVLSAFKKHGYIVKSQWTIVGFYVITIIK